jgi:hypothetical protein
VIHADRAAALGGESKVAPAKGVIAPDAARDSGLADKASALLGGNAPSTGGAKAAPELVAAAARALGNAKP